MDYILFANGLYVGIHASGHNFYPIHTKQGPLGSTPKEPIMLNLNTFLIEVLVFDLKVSLGVIMTYHPFSCHKNIKFSNSSNKSPIFDIILAKSSAFSAKLERFGQKSPKNDLKLLFFSENYLTSQTRSPGISISPGAR